MIELGVTEWFLIALDVFLIVGVSWALWVSIKMQFPNIWKDGRVPIVLTIIYTILLWLYLFGVIRD